MIPSKHIPELLSFRYSLSIDEAGKLSMSSDLEASCGILFRQIAKLLGKPKEDLDFGKRAFFNETELDVASDIRLYALNHIIHKNTHLYFSTIVDAFRSCPEIVHKLLMELKSFDPDTVAKITSEIRAESLRELPPFQRLQKAVEKIFVSDALAHWVAKAQEKDKSLYIAAAEAIQLCFSEEHRTDLMLHGLSLETLPNIFNVEGFKKITTLYLGCNRLKKLPSTLCHLTELHAILLFKNELTSLPAYFSQFVKLRTLSLSDNHLKDHPVGLDDLPELRDLDLRGNKISE